MDKANNIITKKIAAAVLCLALIAGLFCGCRNPKDNNLSGDEGISIEDNMLTTPDLVGKNWDDALASSLLPIKPIVVYDIESRAPKGQITAQHPGPGVVVYCDNDGVCRAVEITVSGGKFSDKYTNLVGLGDYEAMEMLLRLGVKKENVYRRYKANTTGVGNGCVSLFTYENGGEVKEGSQLKETDRFIMTINKYADAVAIPSLGGKSFEQAVELLYQSKLNVGEISYQASGFADGTVLAQFPTSSETAYYGEKIDLVLSTLAGEFEMPSLLGLTVEEAEAILHEKGLELGTIKEEDNREYNIGEVCAQSVKEDKKVYPATVIDISITIGGKADDSIDWDANRIIIDLNANTLLSAGTVELLSGNHANKTALAKADNYIWTMPIGTEYPEGSKGLELGLFVGSGEGYTYAVDAMIEKGYKLSDFAVVVRESEQELPRDITVSVKIGSSFSGKEVQIYRYNETTSSLSVLTHNVYKVDENGYTELEIYSKGIYIVLLAGNEQTP